MPIVDSPLSWWAWAGFALVVALLLIALHKLRRVHLMLFEIAENARQARAEAGSVYRQIESLDALKRLLELPEPLPPLRAWAGSPDFLLALARNVLAQRPQIVFECSSGSSTLVLARCLQRLGNGGRVVSLEHDANYAAATRELLVRHGVAEHATVLHAPLRPLGATEAVGGHAAPWYSTADNAAWPHAIEMLVIDGPPGHDGERDRYPALPVLAEHLAPHCSVFLDDAARADERWAVQQWRRQFPGFKVDDLDCEKGCVRLSRAVPVTGDRNVTSISVVIPCFKVGEYLVEAIESVLAQRGDFVLNEIVVVDDHNDDARTLQVLDSIKAMPQVIVIPNDGPQGSAAARNRGIARATGEWIAFLDADDWLLPDSLAVRVAAARAHPDCDLVGGDFVNKHREGHTDVRGRFESNLDTYRFIQPAYDGLGHPLVLDWPVREFLEQAPIHTVVCMVRRELLLSIGGFDERLLRQQDYHLFLRLATVARFVYVPRVVATVRLHGRNSTKSITETQAWRVVALRDLLARPDFAEFREPLSLQISALLLGNAYAFRAENQFLKAVRSSLDALVSSPTDLRTWRCFASSLLRRG